MLLMQGGDNTMLDLPCPSFLIEHPEGLVLFDTGCPVGADRRRGKTQDRWLRTSISS